MEALECPHCFGRVMVTSNRLCPTCQGDTSAAGSVEIVRIALRVDTPLPQACVLCGDHTKRRTKIVEWERKSTESPAQTDEMYRYVLARFIPFGRLWQAMFSKRAAAQKNLVLKVPLCSGCSAENIRVLDADHSRRTITIAAHVRFAEQISAA